MYPIVNGGVTLEQYYSFDDDKLHYSVTSPDETHVFEISRGLYDAIDVADGTHPFYIPGSSPREIDRCVKDLQKAGILNTSRFVKGEPYNRFILIPIGQRVQYIHSFASVWNKLLPYLTPLCVAIGVVAIICLGPPWSWFRYVNDDINLLVFYACVLLSGALHEAGHLLAGVAYGHEIGGLGILLYGHFPIGAYVSMREPDDAPVKELVQVNLAGIEMNLFLVGVFLIASALCDGVSWTMLYCAVYNIVIVMVNLAPIAGLDGEETLKAMFGTNDVRTLAKRVITDKQASKDLKESGRIGHLAVRVLSYVHYYPVIAGIGLAVAGIAVLVFCVL